jgi:hypothetical protein
MWQRQLAYLFIVCRTCLLDCNTPFLTRSVQLISVLEQVYTWNIIMSVLANRKILRRRPWRGRGCREVYAEKLLESRNKCCYGRVLIVWCRMSNKAREWISVDMCGMLQSCLLGIDLVLHGRGFMCRTTYKTVLEACRWEYLCCTPR